VKVAGLFVHGKWFCTEECSEKDPDTKSMKDLYENGIEFSNAVEGEEEEEEEDGEIEL